MLKQKTPESSNNNPVNQTSDDNVPPQTAPNNDAIFARARRDRSVSPPRDRPLTMEEFLALHRHIRPSASHENTPAPPILTRENSVVPNISQQETPIIENPLLHPLNPFRAETPPAILPAADNDQSSLSSYGEIRAVNEMGDIELVNLSNVECRKRREISVTMV